MSKEGSLHVDTINSDKNNLRIYGNKVDVKNLIGVKDLILHGRDIKLPASFDGMHNVELIDESESGATRTLSLSFPEKKNINITGNFIFIRVEILEFLIKKLFLMQKTWL